MDGDDAQISFEFRQRRRNLAARRARAHTNGRHCRIKPRNADVRGKKRRQYGWLEPALRERRGRQKTMPRLACTSAKNARTRQACRPHRPHRVQGGAPRRGAGQSAEQLGKPTRLPIFRPALAQHGDEAKGLHPSTIARQTEADNRVCRAALPSRLWYEDSGLNRRGRRAESATCEGPSRKKAARRRAMWRATRMGAVGKRRLRISRHGRRYEAPPRHGRFAPSSAREHRSIDLAQNANSRNAAAIARFDVETRRCAVSTQSAGKNRRPCRLRRRHIPLTSHNAIGPSKPPGLVKRSRRQKSFQP